MHFPQLARDVIDVIYPGRCAACSADCDGHAFLCHSCSAGLDHLASQPACERCAAPVVSNGAPCPWCRDRGIYPFKKIVRLGRFGDPLRPLIHAMKYHRRWPLAKLLAERMAQEKRIADLLQNTDALLPVPLHWVRHITRGYNQSDLLATALAKRFDLKIIRPVRRIRRTPSQTGISSRTVREENVRGAFAVKKKTDGVAGKRIVVIDDVMTTAATLHAVARLLVPMHPAGISALVVALTDPKNQDFQAI